MNINGMILRDMKTMKRDTDRMRCCGNTASANSMLKGRKCHTYAPQVPYLAGLNAMLAKAMLLMLLFLGGRMACEACVVIS